MSTKRKAETHSRETNKQRGMKTVEYRTDSERDSGFSDASSEQIGTMDTTDSEDSPRPGSRGTGSGSWPSQMAAVGDSYSSLSPMIIMNNVLLKQPADNTSALKPWGFSPAVDVVQPPQVVFLQPVVSRHSTHKEAASRHRRPKKYLPILKSYPKIAPHPGDGSVSSGIGTASSSSSCSGSESSSSLASSHRERCQRDKQLKRESAGSTTVSLLAPPSAVSPVLQHKLSLPSTETKTSSSPAGQRPEPAVSQSELTPSNHTNSSQNQTPPVPPPQAADPGDCSYTDGDSDMKRKRFCNTYNILSKSGLLDITLRTKELLRQNRRTQSELDRLKDHTDLFLHALRSGDSSVCGALQARLQEEDGEKERERGAQSSSEGD